LIFDDAISILARSRYCPSANSPARVAAENNGLCNLRFDDTNPEKESIEYVRAIEKDVHWLGFEWAAVLVENG
jgi:glutamyl/glutaminyl-tRNA synthetase